MRKGSLFLMHKTVPYNTIKIFSEGCNMQVTNFIILYSESEGLNRKISIPNKITMTWLSNFNLTLFIFFFYLFFFLPALSQNLMHSFAPECDWRQFMRSIMYFLLLDPPQTKVLFNMYCHVVIFKLQLLWNEHSSCRSMYII